MFLRQISIIATALLLAGCDLLGLGPDPRLAQREADGRAIGAACRHAMRGIEDCYRLNERAPKTAVFEGWKEMDQYMRENKIEGTLPKLPAPAASGDEMLTDQQSGSSARAAPREPSR